MPLVPPERRRAAALTVVAAALLAAVVGYFRSGTVGGAIAFAVVIAAGVGVGLLGFELVRRAT